MQSLFSTPTGPSLVSEEFVNMCVDARVEARVQATPNPGDPYRAMRLITFKNFSEIPAKVTQYNKKNQTHIIPGKGELQIMLTPDEQLPLVEKGPNAT